MNHQKESAKIVNYVENCGTDEESPLNVSLAQTHALLAVVEQLRIGNLLALATRAPMSGDGDGILAIYVDEDEYAIRPEIAEALGIEQS